MCSHWRRQAKSLRCLNSASFAEGTILVLRYIHVGVGGWGLDWELNPIPRVKSAERVACVDASPAILKEAQKALGVDPSICYESLETAFAEVDADAVLVTVPLSAHAPVSIAALSAGKHVLVEKPFAPTVDEAKRIVDVAKANDRVLMVSQNYRFFPAPIAVADIIRRGELGAVGEIHVDFRRYVTASAGGHRHFQLLDPLLVDMAIHHFDAMRFVLGQEPVSITCETWNPVWSPFTSDAAGTAVVKFDGGASVSWRGSWVSPGPTTNWAGEWRAECENGEIVWTSRGDGGKTDQDRVTIRRSGEKAVNVELPKLEFYGRSGTLNAFAEAIASANEPGSSGRDNLASLDLAYSAVASAAEHRTIPLPTFS
jgi:predicted dehydrogenase